MFKHMQAMRRRIDERRRYERLLAKLERINTADVGQADLCATVGARQVFGDGQR